MKIIKFNGQQINVPTNWSEISLGDYEKWYANKQKNQTDSPHSIAAFCKVDAKIFKNAPKEIFDSILKIIEFVSESNFEPLQAISIDHELYNISATDKLTLGEWVDTDSILNSESETTFSDILGIVCRPMGESYNHETAVKRAKLFRQQSCDKILPLISFFLLRGQKSKEILSHSSMVVEAANQYLQDIKTFAANGDGIKRLPIWQRIRYSYLIKSLEKQLSKFSDSYSIG